MHKPFFFCSPTANLFREKAYIIDLRWEPIYRLARSWPRRQRLEGKIRSPSSSLRTKNKRFKVKKFVAKGASFERKKLL